MEMEMTKGEEDALGLMNAEICDRIVDIVDIQEEIGRMCLKMQILRDKCKIMDASLEESALFSLSGDREKGFCLGGEGLLPHHVFLLERKKDELRDLIDRVEVARAHYGNIRIQLGILLQDRAKMKGRILEVRNEMRLKRLWEDIDSREVAFLQKKIGELNLEAQELRSCKRQAERSLVRLSEREAEAESGLSIQADVCSKQDELIEVESDIQRIRRAIYEIHEQAEKEIAETRRKSEIYVQSADWGREKNNLMNIISELKLEIKKAKEELRQRDAQNATLSAQKTILGVDDQLRFGNFLRRWVGSNGSLSNEPIVGDIEETWAQIEGKRMGLAALFEENAAKQKKLSILRQRMERNLEKLHLLEMKSFSETEEKMKQFDEKEKKWIGKIAKLKLKVAQARINRLHSMVRRD
jgi:chromosome segregation ATPase